MRALKIALVAPHYPPDVEANGTLNLARAEAKSLAANGHEVRVIAGASWLHAGRDVVHGEVDGIPVSWLPRLEGEQCPIDWTRPRWTALAIAELKSAHAAHVFHGPTLSSDLIQQIARRMPCLVSLDETARALATCHPPLSLEDKWREGGREFLEGRLRRRRDAFERDLRAADRLLVASTRELERFEECLSRACASLLQIHSPGLCLEVPEEHDAVRRTPWQGDRPISLLHFGHRREDKGLLDLVHALRELPSGTIELVACGPEEQPGFDAQLRAAAGDHFPLHLFGAYDGGQLAALASACDFAAFPTRIDESDALVVDEALALGLPVWASTGADPQGRIQGGSRAGSETLESAPGRVLHAADPQAWQAAFEELLSAPEQHEQERTALAEQRGNQRSAQEAATELEDLLLELQAPLAGSKAEAATLQLSESANDSATQPRPLSHAS